LAGECFAVHQLGYLDDASRKLDEMVALSASTDNTAWLQIAQMIRMDLSIQSEIRRSPELGDHVFWRAATLMSRGCHANEPIETQMLPAILARRLQYLQQVRSLARGDARAISGLERYLAWASDALPGHQRYFKVEAALAALAGGEIRFADTLLDGRRQRSDSQPNSAIGRWDFEYLYCTAKLHKLLGRAQEATQQFEQYALNAMQCIRAEVLPVAPYSNSRAPDAANVLDDIGVLLPPRYRRAYAFMLENLGNPKLSVREIAAHIGVTQRSLQTVFKLHVGISPKDVLQRKRMERIREELSADQRTHLSILEVARKWGIPNRSKLANWYRRQYRGKPSDVLVS
jgi:AraC-like DNA-binding protein